MVAAQVNFYEAGIADPSAKWNAAVMKELGVMQIVDRHTRELFQFQPDGTIQFYSRRANQNYYEPDIIITYHPNGTMACMRSYYSFCYFEEHSSSHNGSVGNTIPVCFDLMNNPGLLDTSKAEKIPYPVNADYVKHHVFWKQQIQVDGYSLYAWYQVATNGEIFYLKWSRQDDITSAKMNQSLLRSKLSFDSTGVISESVRFEMVGSEWSEYGDTVTYLAFQNVNGFPRCTNEIRWCGSEYEGLEKAYMCIDTDGKPGIDTCWFLSQPKFDIQRYTFCFNQEEIASLNRTVYFQSTDLPDTCFYKKVRLYRDFENFSQCTHQPYAESFVYTENGEIVNKTYYAHCSYAKPTVNDDKNYRVDSLTIRMDRVLPDRFYEFYFLEMFDKTANFLEDCHDGPSTNSEECFYYHLAHNKGVLYTDKNWIYDPDVRCDTVTRYKNVMVPLSKTQYRKNLKAEIVSMRMQLSDTTRYEVVRFQ